MKYFSDAQNYGLISSISIISSIKYKSYPLIIQGKKLRYNTHVFWWLRNLPLNELFGLCAILSYIILKCLTCFFFIVKTTNLDTTMTSIGYVIQISRSYQNVKDDDVFDQFLPSIMYLNRIFFQTKGQIFIILIYFDNGVMTIILLNLIKFELYNSFLETVHCCKFSS